MKPRLLVMELWGLGDLVIATPFLQAAALRFEVTLVARPYAQDLRPFLWPDVQVLPFTAPWTAFEGKYRLWRWPWREMLRLRRDFLGRGFDCGVSARWDPRDHLALFWSGARERFGFPRLRSERYLTRPLVRPLPAAHRLEYWRALGNALGFQLPPRSQLFPTSPAKSPMILLHSGARLPLRVWPLASYREVVARLRALGYQVRIACDADQLAGWRSAGEVPDCPRSVAELIHWLRQGAVFVGNDSGPGHLAAALGLPTFTFFGPQLPEWFIPLHPASEVMVGKSCPYKPCSDYCRFAKPFCLWDIGVDQAWLRLGAFVRKNLDISPR